ncbi:MAG: pseudouridine synthase [Patescibacteria group bacterium]|nr:pseudouridine synthase [Patescibacteria group bacterium]
MEKINLTKFIADNSNYSRRQAEVLIKKGFVIIDGKTAKLGEKANNRNEVSINGEKIKTETNKIYIKLNKPSGYVCSNKSFANELNIFSLVKIKERLFSIGRLDKDSCGLIILTNDGDLTYNLTHPKFEHQKTYLITLKKDFRLKNNNFIRDLENKFQKGIDIGEKTLAKVKEIIFLSENDIKIILAEGKKRQIREMFKIFDLRIERLQRVNFAGVGLGSLKEGEWEYLSKDEINKLKK